MFETVRRYHAIFRAFEAEVREYANVGCPRPTARCVPRCSEFSGGIGDFPDKCGQELPGGTKNVTSRHYLPANVTNIVMQMRQEEESQGYGKWCWSG